MSNITIGFDETLQCTPKEGKLRQQITSTNRLQHHRHFWVSTLQVYTSSISTNTASHSCFRENVELLTIQKGIVSHYLYNSKAKNIPTKEPRKSIFDVFVELYSRLQIHKEQQHYISERNNLALRLLFLRRCY